MEEIIKLLKEKEERLNRRLSFVIKNYCNEIGCKNCPAKWDDGCQATEIQNEIYSLKKN